MDLTDRALLDARGYGIQVPVEVVYYRYPRGYRDVLYLVVSHVVYYLHQSPERVRVGHDQDVPPARDLVRYLVEPHRPRALHAIEEGFREGYLGRGQVGVTPVATGVVHVPRGERRRSRH